MRLRDTVTGQEEDAALAGLFVYVGLQPNTELLAGLVELDGGGHVR